MAEDRLAKGGFRDENIAGHDLERRACRIWCVLVITGRNNARSPACHRDLSRAQHMSRGMKGYGHVLKPDALTVGNRLRRTGEIIAITQPHNIERIMRRQYRAVAGTGLVGMAMRVECALHGPHRIDLKATVFAAKPSGNRLQEWL